MKWDRSTASRKIIDRVEKLIALAGSNNENEARNAAYLAAKLIREHKLTFAEEDSFEVFQASSTGPARKARSSSDENPPDEDIDWGTSRARPKEVTDEEAEDLFRDWKPHPRERARTSPTRTWTTSSRTLSDPTALRRPLDAMARNIFIGDVHGCLDEFEALIRKIEPGREDQVFCVGDFMDRGPEPAECVRFARESGFQSVLGNHEEKHLRWRRHEDRRARDPKYQNPMRPLPPQRQAENAALTAEDIAWLEGLPLVLEPLPGWILVHGGLFPGKSIAAHLKDRDLRDKIIRLRWLDENGEFVKLEDDTAADGPPGSQPWMQSYDGRSNVVYGHAVHSLSTPRIDVQHHATHETKTFGIDTGCVFGGALTALIVEERRCLEVVQVKAQRQYATPRVPIAH